MVQAGDGHNGMAGNVHQRLSNAYCPESAPESAALLPDPGDLIPPRFDAVLPDSERVFQRAFTASVVPPLPGQQTPELDANVPVRIVLQEFGKLTK